MGTVLSAMQRKVMRRIRRFNVDNRAEKLITQDKRKASPFPTQTLREIELIKREFPDAAESQLKKDAVLDDRLKQVFVTSTDPSVLKETQDQSSRPLPQGRHRDPDAMYYLYSPQETSTGRCSIKQALQFITDHHAEPSIYTASMIAKKHTLDESIVEKVLLHYDSFIVQNIPPDYPDTLIGYLNKEPELYGFHVTAPDPKEQQDKKEKKNVENLEAAAAAATVTSQDQNR